MEMNNLPQTCQEICTICYPNNWEKMREATAHLFNEDAYCIRDSGYEAAIREEMLYIEKNNEGKHTECLCLDREEGIYICRKHLLEIAEKMVIC